MRSLAALGILTFGVPAAAGWYATHGEILDRQSPLAGATLQLAVADETITAEKCRWFVRHVPAPNVAYQPGVDANGNAVVPADLHSKSIKVKGPYQFDVERNVSKRTDTDMKINLGTVEIDSDTGHTIFNGEALTADEMRALASACRKTS